MVAASIPRLDEQEPIIAPTEARPRLSSAIVERDESRSKRVSISRRDEVPQGPIRRRPRRSEGARPARSSAPPLPRRVALRPRRGRRMGRSTAARIERRHRRTARAVPDQCESPSSLRAKRSNPGRPGCGPGMASSLRTGETRSDSPTSLLTVVGHLERFSNFAASAKFDRPQLFVEIPRPSRQTTAGTNEMGPGALWRQRGPIFRYHATLAVGSQL